MRRIFIVLYITALAALIFFLLYFCFAFFEPPTLTFIESETEIFIPIEATEILTPPGLPLQLVIPSIGVSTTIEHVGLSKKSRNEMEAPSNFTNVAWYMEGTRPGAKGSAVITGHFNGKNTPKAVFYDLAKLELGDRVLVLTESKDTLTFQVVKIKTYNYNDKTDSVFLGDTTKARLNLITCAGSWMTNISLYDKRTVVFTELVTEIVLR